MCGLTTARGMDSPLGEACRKVRHCAGARHYASARAPMPLDIRATGATMAVSSGYKWMLGPYGSGFFWIAEEWIERLPLGAVYFMALEGAHDFHSMHARAYRAVPGARRWDSPETANFMNLAAYDASLDLILRIGPGRGGAARGFAHGENHRVLAARSLRAGIARGARETRAVRLRFGERAGQDDGAVRRKPARRISTSACARTPCGFRRISITQRNRSTA